MRRHKKLILCCLAAAYILAGAGRAEDTGIISNGVLHLTLERATMLALQNNRELEIEAFAPALAAARENIERGLFDPEIFAELDYGESTSSETSRSSGEQFSVKDDERYTQVGTRKRMVTGTEVEATVEQSRDASDRTPEQEEARLGLEVSQELLQGFGPSVNLAAVRQAALGVSASRYELRGFTESLAADTETAYWRYILAREEIRIFEESLRVAKQQLKNIESRIEVGGLAENDAAAPRSEVALREQELIEARGGFTEAKLRLLQIIYPDSLFLADLDVEAIIPTLANPEPITNFLPYVDRAVELRPDLNEARLRLEQDRLETVITRNGLLPKLELFVALGKTGFADSFMDSFSDLDGDGYDVTAGVRLSHFIGNREAKGRHEIAVANRDQARIAVNNLRDLVCMDVRLAINKAEQHRREIAATAVTRVLQEQTVKAEQERFLVGSGTALLVSQAQRDLLAAQIAEVEAVADYRIALIHLYLAEGSLLERRGIVVDAATESW